MKPTTFSDATPAGNSSPAAPVRKRLAALGIVLFAVMMSLYGLLAIETAQVNFAATYDDSILQQRLETRAQARAGQTDGIEARAWPSSGLVWVGISKLTSPEQWYGSEGMFDTVIHYAELPKSLLATLSLHSLLGGICMTIGGLQFWPAFRRRYPRWHRAAGVTYIVTAQAAMIMAMVFLVRTPLRELYDTLTFSVGLWYLALGVTLSLWLSIYHLSRREIAQHQVYMAISYALLLTAPFTRVYWAGAGMLFPESSQLVVNYVASAVLTPTCILMGYALLCLNRWLQDDRATPNPRPGVAPAWQQRLSRLFTLLAMLLAAAGAVTVLWFYVITPGLAVFPLAGDLVPATVIAHDSAVLGGLMLSRLIYATSTLLALLIMLPFLWHAFAARGLLRKPLLMRAAAGLAVLAAVSAAVLIHWGWLLGGPSPQVQSGGAPLLLNGACLLLFACLLGRAVRRENLALVKEHGVFMLFCLLATPLFYWALPIFGCFPVPADIVQQGHLYRLSMYAGLYLLIFAMVYSAYGSATQAKFAR